MLNEFSTQTALNWAEEYAKANRRKIVEAKPGDGLTIFSIIYTSSDGFVISQGRDISVHPKLDGQNFQAGNNVVINKNMELKFIEKSLGASKGR